MFALGEGKEGSGVVDTVTHEQTMALKAAECAGAEQVFSY
jgi:hypothetical protein